MGHSHHKLPAAAGLEQGAYVSALKLCSASLMASLQASASWIRAYTCRRSKEHAHTQLIITVA
jgi:hypothetical protein